MMTMPPETKHAVLRAVVRGLLPLRAAELDAEDAEREAELAQRQAEAVARRVVEALRGS